MARGEGKDGIVMLMEITIQLTDEQGAKVRDSIDKRLNFRLEGFRVSDSDGKELPLRSIDFSFADKRSGVTCNAQRGTGP